MSLLRLRTTLRLTPTTRGLSSTALRRTSAGYGDPQDEKIENKTPTPQAAKPSSASKSGAQSADKGTTDPETARAAKASGNAPRTQGGSVGNAGGEEGSGGSQVDAQQLRETKKVGEEPKQTTEGGAGPKGG